MASSAAGFTFCVLLFSSAVGTSQVDDSSTIDPDPEQLASRIRALVHALQDADHFLRVFQDYRKNDAGVLNSMKTDSNQTMIERLKSIMSKGHICPMMSTLLKTKPKKAPTNETQQFNKIIIKDQSNVTARNSAFCRTKPCGRAQTKTRMLQPGDRTKPRNAKRRANDRSVTTTKKLSALPHTTGRSNVFDTPIITNIYPMFGPGSNERRDPVEFVPKETGAVGGAVNIPSKYLLPPLPPNVHHRVFLGETSWIPIASPFEENYTDKDLYQVAANLSVEQTIPKKHKTLSFNTKEWKYTNVDVQREKMREQDRQLQLLHHIQQIKRMHPQDLPKTVAETMYFNEIGGKQNFEGTCMEQVKRRWKWLTNIGSQTCRLASRCLQKDLTWYSSDAKVLFDRESMSMYQMEYIILNNFHLDNYCLDLYG